MKSICEKKKLIFFCLGNTGNRENFIQSQFLYHSNN